MKWELGPQLWLNEEGGKSPQKATMKMDKTNSHFSALEINQKRAGIWEVFVIEELNRRY